MLSPHTYTHTYAESNGPKIEEKPWYDGSHTRLWGEGNKQKTTNTFFKVIAVDYMKINKHVRLSVAVSPIIIRHTRCRIYVCTIIALGIQVFFWVVGGECVGGNEWILIQTPYTILPTEHTQSIGGIFQISATFWVCCRPKIPQSFIHFLPQHWTSNSRFMAIRCECVCECGTIRRQSLWFFFVRIYIHIRYRAMIAITKMFEDTVPDEWGICLRYISSTAIPCGSYHTYSRMRRANICILYMGYSMPNQRKKPRFIFFLYNIPHKK